MTDRYDSGNVGEVLGEMVKRGTISESSKNLAVKGGAIIPNLMGGPLAKRVGAKSHRSLFVLDLSGSQHQHVPAVKTALYATRDALKEVYSETGLKQLLGVVGFNVTGWVIMPFTNVEDVDDTAFENITAKGWTALWDATGAAILGDAAYGHLLGMDGATGEQSSIYVFTDTGENSSVTFKTADAVAQVIAEGRKTRRRRFGAFGFGPETQVIRSNLRDMGFLDRNIVLFDEGFTTQTIKDAFYKSSQSVAAVSLKISQPGATSPSQSPGNAADNMMFT